MKTLVNHYLNKLGLNINGIDDIPFKIDNIDINPEYHYGTTDIMWYWGVSYYYLDETLVAKEHHNGRDESTFIITEEGKVILKQHILNELNKKLI